MLLVRLLQLVILVFAYCRLFDVGFTLFGGMFVVIVVITMDRAGFLGFVAFDLEIQKPNLAVRLGKALSGFILMMMMWHCTGLASHRH